MSECTTDETGEFGIHCWIGFGFPRALEQLEREPFIASTKLTGRQLRPKLVKKAADSKDFPKYLREWLGARLNPPPKGEYRYRADVRVWPLNKKGLSYLAQAITSLSVSERSSLGQAIPRAEVVAFDDSGNEVKNLLEAFKEKYDPRVLAIYELEAGAGLQFEIFRDGYDGDSLHTLVSWNGTAFVAYPSR